MSKRYAFIKKMYDCGVYNKTQVRVFVDKGQITTEEYKIITGEDY